MLVAVSHDLDGARAELQTLKTVTIPGFESKVAEQTTQLNTCGDEKNAAIAAAEDAKHRYHRLKFYVCTLGAALAGLVISRFKLYALGAPGLIATLAAPAAVFGLLWAIL